MSSVAVFPGQLPSGNARMATTADLVASLVQQEYDKLPAKWKPAVRDNGIHEWVPLSGVVAQIATGEHTELRCLSLATGMKCLPHGKLPLAQGNVLHDWHAEVLAMRAFNRFVLDECIALLEGGPGATSLFLRRREENEHVTSPGAGSAVWDGQPLAWREDVELYMYCSEAPCGDASMELTMASQEDATPWAVPAAARSSPEDPAAALPGRAYFSHLGLVRRKPARGDAPPTLSKSCSDKMALRQCTSLLSSLSSILVSPAHAYLSTVVLPASQYSASGCRRAFSTGGRMAAVEGGDWGGGYHFRPFSIETTSLEFAFSKRRVLTQAAPAGKTAASNLAVAWTGHGCREASLGGTLQGRKLFDPRGASFVSNRIMWTLALVVAGMLGVAEDEARKALAAPTYAELKRSRLLGGRSAAKKDATTRALPGWTANQGDGFSLAVS